MQQFDCIFLFWSCSCSHCRHDQAHWNIEVDRDEANAMHSFKITLAKKPDAVYEKSQCVLQYILAGRTVFYNFPEIHPFY